MTPDDKLADIVYLLLDLNRKADQIMTAQQDIDQAVAVVTTLLADVQTQVGNLASDLQLLTTELAGQGVNTTSLNSVVAQVSAIQSALDSGVAGITGLATSSEPPPPPPTPPTPGG